MIGVGTSLLFDRRAGKAGSPTFNKALVDAWFMSGLSNIDKPSSIRGVKGNEVVLKNFAYALSSGFGKYEVDFNSWANNASAANFTKSDSVIHLTEIKVAGSKFLGIIDGTITPSFQIKAEGLIDGINLRYLSYAEDDTVIYTNLQNGINKLPTSYNKYNGFLASPIGACNITITQLPSAYEGALVFDGVDDYAYVDNFDTLIDGDEFTTIGYYEVIPQGNKSSYNLYARSSNANWSRIETPSITTPSSGKRSYTVNYTSNTSSYDILEGESFKMDKAYKVFPKRFSLSGWFDEANNYLFDISKVAHYWVAIYKGKLTPEEIETEKERLNEEWLKRSKVTIPKPDVYYDLSLKDNSSPTRSIMDDLSGNGHDAEIFNAAYTESSGYRSDGAFVFDGVDDYAIMKNVEKGFKTLFVEVVPLNLDATMYDQRINASYTNFSIFNKSGYVAYEYNNKGLTYINGKQSTANDLADNLLNKRQIITVINGKQSDCKTIYIAANYKISSFSNMAFYKLIGFYDELTPLQIEKVINDYKLKYD